MLRPMSLLVFAAVLLVTLPAAAADNGFYLGASVGDAAIESEELGGAELDSDDLGYKVFVGYRFITFLGAEGSYVDFGAPEDDLASVDAHYEASVDGFDLFAVGYLPLGIADIFAKAGMVDWDADVEGTVGDLPFSGSDSGTDPAYGLGVQLRIQSFTLRVEGELFDIEGTKNVYLISAGAAFTF